MSILDRLATSLNRRDEAPNQELAAEIAKAGDKAAVKELVANLHNKDKNIQSDCIKTLDEVAMIKPEMVSPYLNALLSLLDSKNNRMVWGAMGAIDAISGHSKSEVRSNLARVMAAADKGSVITKDHAVSILVKLSEDKSDDTIILLLDILKESPVNQFPFYAEKIMPVIPPAFKDEFKSILEMRLTDIEQESKRKRVIKALKKLG